MSKFVVHLGVHKTGTTAFQRFLQESRESLNSAGLFVPELDSEQAGNCRGLARAMAGEYETYPVRQRRLLQPLQAVFHPEFRGDVLISSEYLSTSSFKPYLEGLAKSIESMDFQKIAILVIRDQISWFNSRISQKRKMLHETTQSFRQRVEEMMLQNEGCWHLLIHHLKACGFDVITLAYDKHFLEQGVVRSLFQTEVLKSYGMGIIYSEPTHHNVTFGAKHQILADLVREYVTDKLGIPTHRIDRNAMKKIMQNEFKGKMQDAPFNGFSPVFHKHVAKYYEKGNENVARQWLNREWHEVFPSGELPEVSPEFIEELPQDEQRLLRDIADNVILEASSQGILPVK